MLHGPPPLVNASTDRPQMYTSNILKFVCRGCVRCGQFLELSLGYLKVTPLSSWAYSFQGTHQGFPYSTSMVKDDHIDDMNKGRSLPYSFQRVAMELSCAMSHRHVGHGTPSTQSTDGRNQTTGDPDSDVGFTLYEPSTNCESSNKYHLVCSGSPYRLFIVFLIRRGYARPNHGQTPTETII